MKLQKVKEPLKQIQEAAEKAKVLAFIVLSIVLLFPVRKGSVGMLRTRHLLLFIFPADAAGRHLQDLLRLIGRINNPVLLVRGDHIAVNLGR